MSLFIVWILIVGFLVRNVLSISTRESFKRFKIPIVSFGWSESPNTNEPNFGFNDWMEIFGSDSKCIMWPIAVVY